MVMYERCNQSCIDSLHTDKQGQMTHLSISKIHFFKEKNIEKKQLGANFYLKKA
jgi:hypothetical protein